MGDESELQTRGKRYTGRSFSFDFEPAPLSAKKPSHDSGERTAARRTRRRSHDCAQHDHERRARGGGTLVESRREESSDEIEEGRESQRDEQAKTNGALLAAA